MELTWLNEALFAGQTANGFKLGTAVSLGWFWMRVRGCRLVCRGESMEAVDFGEILVVAEPDAAEIAIPTYVPHKTGHDYFYVVRSANRCGQIERTLSSAVKVSIGEDGALKAARPNGILGLTAWRGCDGRVEVIWHYNPMGQASSPSEMRVYCDEGMGQVDYENPVAVVQYKGRRFYRYRSEPRDNGRYLFAVKVVDAKGNECEPIRKVSVEVGGTTPEAIEIIGITSV
jgi:hypothetical protein